MKKIILSIVLLSGLTASGAWAKSLPNQEKPRYAKIIASLQPAPQAALSDRDLEVLSAKLEAYLYEKYELPAQQLRQQLRAGEQVVVTNAQGEIVYQNVPGQRPVIPTNAQLWFSRDGVDYYLVF